MNLLPHQPGQSVRGIRSVSLPFLILNEDPPINFSHRTLNGSVCLIGIDIISVKRQRERTLIPFWFFVIKQLVNLWRWINQSAG